MKAPIGPGRANGGRNDAGSSHAVSVCLVRQKKEAGKNDTSPERVKRKVKLKGKETFFFMKRKSHVGVPRKERFPKDEPSRMWRGIAAVEQNGEACSRRVRGM